MTGAGTREALVETAHTYRRLHEEHRRSHPEGHTRRRLGARLHELSERFERGLRGAGLDEETRARWRAHLLHGGPAPDLPEPAQRRHRWRR